MKKHVKIIAILSMTLLLCTLIGQLIWLIKIKSIKRNEFIKISNMSLSQCVHEYLETEMMNRSYGFYCALRKDGRTFAYDKNKSVQINGLNEFSSMAKRVFYDHIYNRRQLNLNAINALYIKQLQQKGIKEIPRLEIQTLTGQRLFITDSSTFIGNQVKTKLVEVGYENKHAILATFQEPNFFSSLDWHLFSVSIFFIGFCVTLWWLWILVKADLKMAEVQTMGIAHLEHELKKPLMTLLAITKNIYINSQKNLYTRNQEYIEIIHGRLMKFQNIIDTMLYALKTDRIEISRQTIDLYKEIGQAVSVYGELKIEAIINYHIAKGCEQALLDEVYFGRLVSNLIDNGIKYNKSYPPKIDIDFRRENNYWVLTLSDNGIGIPEDKIKQIFKRFYRIEDKSTAKRTGFGLGLAFVKQVVDAYNGCIIVRNNKTGGTTFIIRLPIT